MYQEITIVGNLGADPEMKYLQDGQAVTNFSLASNRKWKTREGQPAEETTWFRVSVFGPQAEACEQYLAKGRQVLVVGRLRPGNDGGPRTFERRDGSTGASFEVTASTVRFLQGGERDSGQAGQQAVSETDEVPF